MIARAFVLFAVWISCRELHAAENRVLQLDGRGSYLQLPIAPLAALTEFTIEAWVKPAQYGPHAAILSLSRPGQENGLVLEVAQAPAAAEFEVLFRSNRRTEPMRWQTSLSLIPDRWTHLAIVVRSRRLQLFVNSALCSDAELSVETSLAGHEGRFILGKPEGSFVLSSFMDFAGQIDEVRAWSSARDARQIRATMFQRLAGIADSSLEAVWNFDDGSAEDSSGNGHHGQLFGAARPIEAASPSEQELRAIDQVLVLDGNQSYVALPTDLFSSLGDATVECWVRWKDFTSYFGHRVFSYGEMFNDWVLGSHLGGAPHLEFRNPGPVQALMPGRQDLKLNRWYHIAAVSGSAGMRLYLNGVLLGTNQHTGSFKDLKTSGLAYIGKWTGVATNLGASFNGEIGEFRVWRECRTEEQIRTNMTRRLTGREPGLFGLWNFADRTARDASTNGRHGELKGNARVLAQRLPESRDVNPPAVIRARLTDEAGAMLPFFQMHVFEDTIPTLSFTNATGATNLQFCVYPQGRAHKFVAQSSDKRDTLTVASVKPGETHELNFVLSDAATLTGTVRMFDGTPHVAVPVQALDSAHQVVRTSLTDEQGHYRIEKIKTGSYFLRAMVRDGYEYFVAGNKSSFVPASQYLRGRDAAGGAGAAGDSNTPFPLSPALSPEAPEEREASVPSSANSVARRQPEGGSPVRGGNTVLPLPEGEGRGEGEGSVNEPSAPTAPTAPNPKSQIPARLSFSGGGANLKSLLVPPGETLEKLDFRFAPFKKGTWKTYDSASGLPRNPTGNLALETNGTVRVRTSDGIVSRFDGRGFTGIAKQDDLLSPGIRSRFRARDGSRFAHTGNRLVRLDGEKHTPIGEADGLPDPSVNATASDTNGLLWIGTSRGLRLFDGKQFSLPKELELLKEIAVNAVGRAKDGTMWIGSATGAFHYSGDRLARLSTQDGLLQDQVNSLDVSSAGVVWFGFSGQNGGMTRYDGKTCVNFTTADGLPHRDVRQVLVGLDGTLWISTLQGLAHYDANTFMTLTARDGLMEARVNTITQSRAGGLWFASGFYGARGGMFYYDRHRVIDVGAKLGLRTTFVRKVCEDSRGALWIGTRDVGLWHWDGTNSNAAAVLPDKFRSVHGIWMEKEGTLWIGAGGSLWRLDEPGHLTEFTEKDGMPPASSVWDMARGPDGTLWVGAAGGGFATGHLLQYDGQKFIRQFANYGLDDAAVGQIAPCPDGTVWVATSKGIVRIKDGNVSRFTTAEGLANSAGEGVHATPDGHVYFATFGGVSHYDGVTWINLDKRDGLVDNTVASVCPGDGGEIWFGSDGGVSRYRPNNVAPIARVIGVLTDQLRTNLSSLPRFTTGSRLSLLFDSIDMKTVPEKRLFRCRIMAGVKTASEVGGTRESPDFRAWLSASKETQHDWTPREPGTYTFAVQAIDRDLNYSEPATVVLSIFAPWYANA